MQLSELRGEMETTLQDTSNNYWGATELNGYINHAIDAVAMIAPWDLLGDAQGIETANITADTVNYDLPDDFLAFKKAKWNGAWATMVPIQAIDLLDTNPFYAGSAQYPKCYIVDNDIYYSPSVTPGVTDGRLLYYAEEPADLSADSDPSPLNGRLDKAIIYNGLSQAFAKDDPDMSKHYKDMYLQEMKEVGAVE